MFLVIFYIILLICAAAFGEWLYFFILLLIGGGIVGLFVYSHRKDIKKAEQSSSFENLKNLVTDFEHFDESTFLAFHFNRETPINSKAEIYFLDTKGWTYIYSLFSEAEIKANETIRSNIKKEIASKFGNYRPISLAAKYLLDYEMNKIKFNVEVKLYYLELGLLDVGLTDLSADTAADAMEHFAEQITRPHSTSRSSSDEYVEWKINFN